MEKIVSLCKRRGFVFPSSEIYGGLNGVWDYGPLGAELKRNLKDYWWRCMTQLRDDIVGMDGAILMNRNIWKASGHESTFSDPMVDCKTCKGRFREDQLDSSECKMKPSKTPRTCGGELSAPRQFNLMLKTYIGAMEDDSNLTYLRPETAQAIFVQFKNVLEVARKKLPFGIAQIGKAFRNEINPRNFTFRSREFEQMELEFFVKPGTGQEWLEYWKEERIKWYIEIGIPREKIPTCPRRNAKQSPAPSASAPSSTPISLRIASGIMFSTGRSFLLSRETQRPTCSMQSFALSRSTGKARL